MKYFALWLAFSFTFSTDAVQAIQSNNSHSVPNSQDFTSDTRHEDELSYNERKRLIEKGYRIIKDIVAGRPVSHHWEILKNIDCRLSKTRKIRFLCHRLQDTSADRRAYLESLIAVLWALSDYAQHTGHEFMNGAYSVIDPEGKLYHFFEHYALLAGQVHSVDDLHQGSLSPLNPLANVFAYSRHPQSPIISGSSHYKTTTKTQVGVDARFGLTSDYDSHTPALPVLPYKKTHFIFGQVTTLAGVPKTFIKNEFHGLSNLSSWTQHAQAFMHSQHNREGKQRSEKDIPAPIAQAIMNFIKELKKMGTIDQTYFNDIDKTIYQTLMKITDIRALKAKNDFDISGLYAFINHLLQFMDVDNPEHRRDNFMKNRLHGAALEVIQALEGTYHDGIFEGGTKIYYRTGNEVVIDLDEVAAAH